MGNVGSCGELITHSIESQLLAGNLIGESYTKQVLVHLPDGYQQSQENYPVVYWFPGANQTQTFGIEVDSIDQEFATGRSSPAIVVFMPVQSTFGSALYMSSKAFGDWEGFLTSEVIPLIDGTYRTQSTPAKRGAMGFSLGGLTALMLPVLSPHSFGAVGGNDPSTPFISGTVRDIDETPEGVVSDDEFDLEEFFTGFPDTLAGYADSSIVHSVYGQISARVSPNPASPLLGDLPFDRQGQWIPETRAQWRQYDLLDSDSVELHRDSLQELATVSIILPHTNQHVNTPWNRELVRVLQKSDIHAQGIEFAGDHNDFQHQRFTALLSNVTYGLRGENEVQLDQNTYAQDFDLGLGSDDSGGVLLPPGWSVTDGYHYVFRDRTNTVFDGGNIQSTGQPPFILNLGANQDDDRALGVYFPEDSEGAAIQFLAEVASIEANAFQLRFDIEARDKGGTFSEPDLGEMAFSVVTSLDFGNGLEKLIEVNSDTIREKLQLPLDGNQDDNRVSFDSGILTTPVSEASSLRIRWITDGLAAKQEWVFGLDNVQLNFLLLGDFDDDRKLMSVDIDRLSAAVRAENVSNEYDLNGDRLIDERDRDRWVRELAGTSFGDANLDQSVNFVDLLLLSHGFGTMGGWAFGDFDGDGEVGFPDFLILANNFGQSKVSTVPEPNSAMAIVFLMLVALRRRLARSEHH